MDRRIVVAGLLVCSLIPLAAALRVDHRLLGDDPLITLTYAKNIAAGNGFVFNQGEPVLGTTTPLFALVIGALMAVLPVTGTAIAVWVTAACWVGTIWSFWWFRESFKITEAAAGWIGAAVAVAGWIPHLGMEAYPFALLLVATAGAAYGRRPLLAGILGGLLFLTRGEGILFVGIAGLAGWWALRREDKPGSLLRSRLLAMGLGFLIPLAAWSLYAIPTFGNIFPNTLAAKIAQVESGLWPAFQTRLTGDWIPRWGIGPSLGWPAINLVYVLAAVGLVRLVSRHPRLLVLPAWALAYGAGYSLLGVPGYPWYRLPLEFVLVVLVALAADALASWVPTKRWPACIPGLAVLLALFVPTFQAIREPPVRDKDRAYHAMALWFAENGGEGECIAYMEIGYIGYYTELGIVDLVGLVTPEITPLVAMRDFTTGFWKLKPDYLISLEGSRFTLPIVENPEFARTYRQTAELDGFEGLALTVYKRR